MRSMRRRGLACSAALASSAFAGSSLSVSGFDPSVLPVRPCCRRSAQPCHPALGIADIRRAHDPDRGPLHILFRRIGGVLPAGGVNVLTSAFRSGLADSRSCWPSAQRTSPRPSLRRQPWPRPCFVLRRNPGGNPLLFEPLQHVADHRGRARAPAAVGHVGDAARRASRRPSCRASGSPCAASSAISRDMRTALACACDRLGHLDARRLGRHQQHLDVVLRRRPTPRPGGR